MLFIVVSLPIIKSQVEVLSADIEDFPFPQSGTRYRTHQLAVALYIGFAHHHHVNRQSQVCQGLINAAGLRMGRILLTLADYRRSPASLNRCGG